LPLSAASPLHAPGCGRTGRITASSRAPSPPGADPPRTTSRGSCTSADIDRAIHRANAAVLTHLHALLAARVKPHLVQWQLRHSDFRTTQRYPHTQREELRIALAALPLGWDSRTHKAKCSMPSTSAEPPYLRAQLPFTPSSHRKRHAEVIRAHASSCPF
jgi:hypothetical protein